MCYDTHIAISRLLDVPRNAEGKTGRVRDEGDGGWGGGSWRGSRKLAIAGINQMGAEQSYAE